MYRYGLTVYCDITYYIGVTLEFDEEYDAYEICREIIDHYGANNWIGQSDIDNYLDEYYPNMSDDDRWFVNDRMEKFVDSIDPYRSVTDDEDE